MSILLFTNCFTVRPRGPGSWGSPRARGRARRSPSPEGLPASPCFLQTGLEVLGGGDSHILRNRQLGVLVKTETHLESWPFPCTKTRRVSPAHTAWWATLLCLQQRLFTLSGPSPPLEGDKQHQPLAAPGQTLYAAHSCS